MFFFSCLHRMLVRSPKRETHKQKKTTVNWMIQIARYSARKCFFFLFFTFYYHSKHNRQKGGGADRISINEMSHIYQKSRLKWCRNGEELWKVCPAVFGVTYPLDEDDNRDPELNGLQQNGRRKGLDTLHKHKACTPTRSHATKLLLSDSCHKVCLHVPNTNDRHVHIHAHTYNPQKILHDFTAERLSWTGMNMSTHHAPSRKDIFPQQTGGKSRNEKRKKWFRFLD